MSTDSSIISNWVNPFANQMDAKVVAELKRRTQLLSAVSREQTEDRSLNQFFSPRIDKENDNTRALEWVYQKMAYAKMRPVKLVKSCEDKTGTKDFDLWKLPEFKIPDTRVEQDKTYVDVPARKYLQYGPSLTEDVDFKTFIQQDKARSSSVKPPKITKIPAGFTISTTRFRDKNGDQGGVIEGYGDDLYSVPSLYRDSDGKVKPTIVNSPYRPTVVNGDPSCVLRSLSITNEGVVGSVLRAKMNLKVFTKEALNVIDEWLLRPGNEVIIDWGWSTHALYPELNSETLTAVIFNFSCEYKEDNTWDVSVDAIAKGSLVSGVSFEVQDNNAYDPTSISDSQIAEYAKTIVPNLAGVIKLELANLSASMQINTDPEIADGLVPAEALKNLYGSLYKSKVFPHGIAQFIHPIGAQDDPWVQWVGYAGGLVGATIGAGAVGIGAIPTGGSTLLVGGAVTAGGFFGGRELASSLARQFIDSDYVITQRSYICLSDVVHFFNTILTNEYFPKYLETFEIQVENSPTSYDPNIVSADPLNIMFSDNTTSTRYNYGMSTYGYANKAISTHTHGDITSFYHSGNIKTWEDATQNHKYGPPKGEKTTGNLGHIWISTNLIQEIFIQYKLDTGIDPRYKNIFSFFEQLFKYITNATGGAIRPTFIQDNKYETQLRTQGSKSGIKSIIWIVDANYMESTSTKITNPANSYVFQVNNVGQTLLRNVTMRLKLPSTMQSTAYTFGRAGLNDAIQTLDDIECFDKDGNKTNTQENVEEVYNRTYNALARLVSSKKELEYIVTDPTLTQALQAALFAYVGSPSKAPNANDSVNQGWIFSRLYPAELAFEIDGMSGLKYGNMLKIKDILPTRYFDKVYFTITKIEHTVVDHDWKLNITTIARINESENKVGSELLEKDLKILYAPPGEYDLFGKKIDKYQTTGRDPQQFITDEQFEQLKENIERYNKTKETLSK